VLKKRGGDHERAIREFRIGPGGYIVGDPLRTFQGVLTGVPQYMGTPGPLISGSPSPYSEAV
jgi:circadian clock protein KaiC